MKSDPALLLVSYPQAILHLDADAFFTSVEQALEPTLRGKPVVTGKERGIIACASYEAKALGIKRGVMLSDARKLCPKLVILPSDYETYSLYSKRMFDIIRRFTPTVEEYSVDEAFADVTGLRRLHRCSYEEIARRIQTAIYEELDLSVSVGVSLSKGLAKLCSKFRKPNGFTAVPGRYIHILLQRTPLETVWGFGPNTVNLLHKLGYRTAYDFVCQTERWAGRLLHKPGRELWNELRGNSVWKVTPEEKSTYTTILKSKTFTPASSDRELVFAKLMRNVESAFAKARRYKLRAQALAVVLRRHDFHHDGLEARLNRATSSTIEATPIIRELFSRTFCEGERYRSTMIVLGKLESDISEQFELFEDRLKIDNIRRATVAIDAINKRYGRYTLCSGTSLHLARKEHNSRDDAPERMGRLVRGENRKQRLGFPRMNLAV